ncbi:hypothetical protein ACWD1W_26755 [Streptomyces olivaceoviridis]
MHAQAAHPRLTAALAAADFTGVAGQQLGTARLADWREEASTLALHDPLGLSCETRGRWRVRCRAGGAIGHRSIIAVGPEFFCTAPVTRAGPAQGARVSRTREVVNFPAQTALSARTVLLPRSPASLP